MTPAPRGAARLVALVTEGVLDNHTIDDGVLRKQEFHRLGKHLMAALAKAIGSHAKPTSNLGGIAVGGEVVLAPLVFPGLEVVFPSSNWTAHPEAAPSFYYRRVDGSLGAKKIGPNHWCAYLRLADVAQVAQELVTLLAGPAVPFVQSYSAPPSAARAAATTRALSKTHATRAKKRAQRRAS